jgi:hypothetical protein
LPRSGDRFGVAAHGGADAIGAWRVARDDGRARDCRNRSSPRLTDELMSGAPVAERPARTSGRQRMRDTAALTVVRPSGCGPHCPRRQAAAPAARFVLQPRVCRGLVKWALIADDPNHNPHRHHPLPLNHRGSGAGTIGKNTLSETGGKPSLRAGRLGPSSTRGSWLCRLVYCCGTRCKAGITHYHSSGGQSSSLFVGWWKHLGQAVGRQTQPSLH